MPRCLCLLAEPSVPILIQITQPFGSIRGMVQGCVPDLGADARVGVVWITPPSLCCAALMWEQRGCETPSSFLYHSCGWVDEFLFPFLACAPTPAWAWLGEMKLCFPLRSHAMVARWRQWVRQPFSPTGSCLLALWSLLKNTRNLHFTELNPRFSVLPVWLSLPSLRPFVFKP